MNFFIKFVLVGIFLASSKYCVHYNLYIIFFNLYYPVNTHFFYIGVHIKLNDDVNDKADINYHSD